MLIVYLLDITVNFRARRATVMTSRNTSRRSCRQYLLSVLVLLLAGCASPGATLQVTPRHDAGIQYAPREISQMMDILGYERLQVKDPDTQKLVAIATNNGQYRMNFRYRDNPDIRVAAHIVIGNGKIGLHLYQPGRKDLDHAAMAQFERLRQRLELQYGAGNVSDRHPALAP